MQQVELQKFLEHGEYTSVVSEHHPYGWCTLRSWSGKWSGLRINGFIQLMTHVMFICGSINISLVTVARERVCRLIEDVDCLMPVRPRYLVASVLHASTIVDPEFVNVLIALRTTNDAEMLYLFLTANPYITAADIKITNRFAYLGGDSSKIEAEHFIEAVA